MEIIEVEIEQGYLTIKTQCEELSLTNKQGSLPVAGSPTIDGEKSVDHVVSHPVVLDIPDEFDLIQTKIKKNVL